MHSNNVFPRSLNQSVFVFPSIYPPLFENEIIVCPPSDITPPVPEDWMCVISKLNGRNIEACGKTTIPKLPIPLVKCLCEEDRALAGLSSCFDLELDEIIRTADESLLKLMTALEHISKCLCDHPLVYSAQSSMELVQNIKEMLGTQQYQSQPTECRKLQQLIKELVNDAEYMRNEILLLLGASTVEVQSQTEASVMEINTTSAVSAQRIHSIYRDCGCSIL